MYPANYLSPESTRYHLKHYKQKPFLLRDGNCFVIRVDKEKLPEIEGLSRDTLSILQDSHYNGYVIYHRSEIPEELHGVYDAEGLQSLSIHGGITYAEVGPFKKKEYTKIRKKLRNKYPDFFVRMELFRIAKKEHPYQFICFGFDCAHAGDENRKELKDPQHVMSLTKQMDAQIRRLTHVYPYFKEADDRSKRGVLDLIQNEATLETGWGLGGMLNAMSGNL